jgi:hypothetical protein
MIRAEVKHHIVGGLKASVGSMKRLIGMGS